MERWKPLVDKDFTFLEISDTGRLRHAETGFVFKLRPQKSSGLSICNITHTNVQGKLKKKTIYIARAVCEAFVPKPADFNKKVYRAVHKKGVSKLNNLAKNLCWKSQTEINAELPQNINNLKAKLHKKFDNKRLIDINLCSEINTLLGNAIFAEKRLQDKANAAIEQLNTLQAAQI